MLESQNLSLESADYISKDQNEKENKIIFKYGNPNFASVCKTGVFHVDRTNYIPLIETSGKVLTFLRPRRFGKTMFISMLDYYYKNFI